MVFLFIMVTSAKILFTPHLNSNQTDALQRFNANNYKYFEF